MLPRTLKIHWCFWHALGKTARIFRAWNMLQLDACFSSYPNDDLLLWEDKY